MESMRLLQQRALRQIFQLRPLRTQQAFRQVSSKCSTNQQQCLRRPHNTSYTYPNTRRQYPRTPFSSPRFTKPSRRFHSSQTGGATSSSSSSEESLTLSQRMRKLSREYGYSALGVYLALTALDLPFCYLAVSYLGTERIGRWEHAILSYVKSIVKWPMGKDGAERVEEVMVVEEGSVGKRKRLLEEDETYVVDNHGIGEAEKANQGDNASFWTKLALAYAIHKSFIFIRVPLTAAITPKVVKTLRSWGWKIGKMPTKKNVASTGTGINTGKTGVRRPDK